MGVHSLESATTGSSLAAFIAGAKPNTRPVATAQVKARIIGMAVMSIGVPNAPIRSAIPTPPSTPTMPPSAETTVASVRNC